MTHEVSNCIFFHSSSSSNYVCLLLWF